jgi:hypothetical protein
LKTLAYYGEVIGDLINYKSAYEQRVIENEFESNEVEDGYKLEMQLA